MVTALQKALMFAWNCVFAFQTYLLSTQVNVGNARWNTRRFAT